MKYKMKRLYRKVCGLVKGLVKPNEKDILPPNFDEHFREWFNKTLFVSGEREVYTIGVIGDSKI